MAGVKPDLIPRAVGRLEVILTWPIMSGYGGPPWPKFCTIFVSVGGELLNSQVLPCECDEDTFRNWRLVITVPVALDWSGLSLEIFVERADCFRRWNGDQVVTRGGPHTSGRTAIIGRARVRLFDALVIGDLDEEGEDNKKRRRNEAQERNRLEGTLPFGKAVKLLDWEFPALGDADGQPRSVVRGMVDVRMNLLRLPEQRGREGPW